jgi:purine-nucleoside/S-methyl-5'-thioadenosine phosphorylase / adenosine deaminase
MATQAVAGYELRQRAGLRVLAWPALDGLGAEAIVTTRDGGVSAGVYATLNLSFSVGDEPGNVVENRRRAAAAAGAGLGDLVFARQVHGAAVRVVTGADRGGAAAPGGTLGDADALVTNEPGPVLAVLVADCVPVVLYDPRARVLACVHAGWRGTVARAPGAALAAMETLGARPADVRAGIGPAIGPDRYQVGAEVADAARSAFGPRPFLRPDGTGAWLFDLWAANRFLLREGGVPDRNIHVAGVPTGPDPGLFFSDRTARPCGRFAALARLCPQNGGAG